MDVPLAAANASPRAQRHAILESPLTELTGFYLTVDCRSTSCGGERQFAIAELAASILSSRENPKICGIDDAEVVGDLVAVDMPVPRHLLAQKGQYCTGEILEPSVAFVVGAVPVHQSPQSFDRVQMRAV